MAKGLKLAEKIYALLAILYTLVYWPYVIYDDWGFIEKYWAEHWAMYLLIWISWYLIYFLGFSIYYWVISYLTNLIYTKLLKPKYCPTQNHL